jgi:DNA (cytosine-5)-methyltransferase 1
VVRFGSLFSGIGGLDLGLERAGMECVWQVENDPYAVRVLEKHWPDVERYGDITEVDFGSVERVDLMAGGFPCQDLSYAGKGLGLSGPRSGLWSEYVRAIRVVGPRYVLVENVPGLLGRGMGAVLGDLAALGFDAEWTVLQAAEVGAPHFRERVFVLAHPAGRDGLSRGLLESGGVGQSSLAIRGLPGLPVAERKQAAREWLEREPGVDRMVKRLPGGVDRLRGLGNAVVPQVAQYLGELILDFDMEAA